VQLLTVFRRVGVAVEEVQAAVRRFLMAVIDDGAELPGEGRIRAALTMIVAGFRQGPQVIDDAGTDEGAALVVPGEAPGIPRALPKQLKFPRFRMDAEEDAGEDEVLAALLDVAVIEDAVESVQPAVRTPRQRVGQFMRVGAAEAGDDDFRLAGRLAV